MAKKDDETKDGGEAQTLGDVDGRAAAAAAAELKAAETDDDGGDDDVCKGTAAGVEFGFKRKRAESIQFRRLMQRGRDILALEWLLGPITFERWLAATADEDGSTGEEAFSDLWTAVNEAVGSGN